MISTASEALLRAYSEGAQAALRVQHPACSEFVAMRVAMGDLVEHIRELAGCTDEIEDLRVELDELARGFRK